MFDTMIAKSDHDVCTQFCIIKGYKHYVPVSHISMISVYRTIANRLVLHCYFPLLFAIDTVTHQYHLLVWKVVVLDYFDNELKIPSL